MNNRKTELEVERLVNGAKVTLRREISDSEEITPHITELCEELNKLGGIESIQKTASMSMATTLPIGLTPAPSLNTNISDMPVLTNAPHSYTAGEAIVEILNPEKSVWAQQPRAVKEMQERLTALGVRGVSNIQNFDSAVRSLHNSGKIRREKIDGAYKYFLVTGETA